MINFTFIIYGDINQTSGGYYYDRELIKSLKKRGHSVNIAEAKDRDLKNIQTDIYIIDELCHPDFYRRKDFYRLRRGVPVIGMVHHLAADEDISIMSRLRRLYMERAFFRNLNFAIFNSISTRNSSQLKGRYTGPFMIAVPGRERKPATETCDKTEKSALSLLFLGNVIPRKCLHLVIRHLSGVSGIPYKMIIAGDSSLDPSYTERLKKMISGYKLEKQIMFRGRVSESEKKDILEKTDILLMPSSHEGYGIAYIEALSYGVIPIAGLSGGASELIRNGENGYLIDPSDGGKLKSILNALWENPELKKKISTAACNSWAAHPDWEETFEELIDSLENLFFVRG